MTGHARFSRQDWQALHGALLGLLLVLPLAGLVAWLGQSQRALAQHRATQLHQQLDTMQRQLAELENTYSTVREGLGLYQTLTARGLLVAEPRLQWVEQLQQAETAGLLPALQYRVATPRLLSPTAPSRSLALQGCPIQVQYVVAHERAFSTAHRLMAQLPGQLVPLRCELRRRSASEGGLAVDCDYLGLSMVATATPDGAP